MPIEVDRLKWKDRQEVCKYIDWYYDRGARWAEFILGQGRLDGRELNQHQRMALRAIMGQYTPRLEWA